VKGAFSFIKNEIISAEDAAAVGMKIVWFIHVTNVFVRSNLHKIVFEF
jgi:hypothetical protein